MLRCILIYLFSCLLSISYAQPVFEWVTKTEGHDTDNRPIEIAVKGNSVISTGRFGTTIDFDPGPGVYPLTGSGIYVTKWDTTGYLEWPVKIGDGNDYSWAMALDANNNFYVAGNYSGSTDFDPGPGQAIMTPVLWSDAFIAKYGFFGDYLWAISIGGEYGNSVSAVVLDDTGDIYVVGNFGLTTDFDPGPDSTLLTSIGEEDIFVAKYSTNGNFRWVRHIGGTGRDFGRRITLDSRGDLYVSGTFRGTAYVNPGSPLDTMVSRSNGDNNVFLAKLDTTGNFIWVKNFECTGRQLATDLITDNKGHVYLTGTFRDTVDFDPGLNQQLGILQQGNDNLYLAKYDTNGHFLWVFTNRGSAGADPLITIDKTNNIYLTSYLPDTIDLDPGPDTAMLLGPGKFSWGYFLAKYDPDGHYVWAVPFDVSEIGAINHDSDDGFYFTGRISGVDTMDFDFGQDTTLVIGGGNYDLFTAKYRSRTITDTVAVSICKGDGYTLGYRTYTETGTYYRTYPVRPGLDSMVVVELTVEAPDTSVTRPDHKTLQASNAQAIYQWVDCDNGHTPIPGATAQAFTPAVNGNYAVVVTEAGCTDTSACYAVTSIGVEAGAAAVPLTVYPNPARKQVHLSFYLPEAMDATVRLYDYQGRAVFTKDLGHVAGYQAVTVPVGHLPAGMYQVLLRTELGSAVLKVVVQR